MKRINYFDADRTMSIRVSEFMRCYVWKTEIKLRYQSQIEEAEKALELIDNLRGSIHESAVPAMKDAQILKISALKEERDKLIAEEATFALTEADKEFKRRIRKNPVCAESAIIDWFKEYNLDVEDTALVDEILSATGEKISNRQIVASRGKVATVFNETNCLKMLYAKAYEHMVNAGTIKPTQIPSLMMDKYSPKKKTSKKSAK